MRNKGIAIGSALLLLAVPLGLKINEYRERAAFRDKIAELQGACLAEEAASKGVGQDMRQLVIPFCQPLSEIELNMRLGAVNCSNPSVPSRALVNFQQDMQAMTDSRTNLAAGLDCGDTQECHEYRDALRRAATAYRQQYRMLGECLRQQAASCRQLSDICESVQRICSVVGITSFNNYSCTQWESNCSEAGNMCRLDGPQ